MTSFYHAICARVTSSNPTMHKEKLEGRSRYVKDYSIKQCKKKVYIKWRVF